MYFKPTDTEASISFFSVLANPQISDLRLAAAIDLIAFISPSEMIGNPASMASTPRVSSFCAIASFCSGVNATPGVCSPSLSVVSKILTFITVSSL